MNYKDLNKKQKDKMNNITKSSYFMEFNDSKLMDYLLGDLPKILRFDNDNIAINEIRKLEKTLLDYNYFTSDKEKFLNKLSEQKTEIESKIGAWYGISVSNIESCIDMHMFCLISGVGGIGKSYFIKCLQEQLELKNIEHLCIYGKFEKDTKNINIQEIIDSSDDGFVFIVDAINEMSDEGQRNLLDILKVFKRYPKIRIVLTYRTNSMNKNTLEKYKQLAEYEYRFSGVSYESALSEIVKLSVPDVYMYEDILYSNNALLLNMLCDILQSPKLVKKQENSISTITYIFEQYVKKTIKRASETSEDYQARDIWRDIKNVARWMYINESKNIDEKSLADIVVNWQEFVSVMIQMDFLTSFEIDANNFYSFAIDSLSDFLIARSLFDDIENKKDSEKIRVIKSKIESLNNMEEALIIVIFDKMSPDYNKIQELLEDTGLIESFTYETLLKINFKVENIKDFEKHFSPIDTNDLLESIGGYTNKPFNCSNYLFGYYCSDNYKLKELSNILSGYHFHDNIKNRLKNILYFILAANVSEEKSRYEEAYYFGLLCCAAPNRDIRCLALKLLFEVVSKDNLYINRMICDYNKISDLYIQESIIHVLCQMKKNNNDIVEFLKKIILEQDDITAKSISRIFNYIDKPYSYIYLERKNLYTYNKNAYISKNFGDILFELDYNNKYFLPFRYWSEKNIDMNLRFIVTDKRKVKEINDYLLDQYSCVRGGICSGVMSFEKDVKKEIDQISTLQIMDKYSFMEGLEKVFEYVFGLYELTMDIKTMNIRNEDFKESVLMKCVDLAKGLYLGSLMCNYYTDEFSTFNNIQNSIGYDVYDPLQFGEDINITSPIPTHQGFVEKLGDFVVKNIELPVKYDAIWAKNKSMTRKNILSIIDEIVLNNQRWIVLSCFISLEYNEGDWRDTYCLNCCTSKSQTIQTINENNGYMHLSTELEEYKGNLHYYIDNQDTPWLCKIVKNINVQSSIFEETSLTLPPSSIIKFFNLKLNVSDMSWETENKEKVIICNNNKNTYYKDPISQTVFMRKDFFEKFAENNAIKYFAFAERFTQFSDIHNETSLHFEIIDGKIEKEIRNCDLQDVYNKYANQKCTACEHKYFFNKMKNISENKVKIIFNNI